MADGFYQEPTSWHPASGWPEIKLLLVVLFGLGGLATQAGSEAVLPAYVAGLVVAGVFLHDRVLMDRPAWPRPGTRSSPGTAGTPQARAWSAPRRSRSARTSAVIAAVQDEGTCWCGPTVWQGRAAMRVSVSAWAGVARKP